MVNCQHHHHQQHDQRPTAEQGATQPTAEQQSKERHNQQQSIAKRGANIMKFEQDMSEIMEQVEEVFGGLESDNLADYENELAELL